MKNLSILMISSFLIGMLFKSENLASNVVEYCVEDFQIHKGVLEFNDDKSAIVLGRVEDDSSIKLEFAFDKVEDMVIDDLGLVEVVGYYSRIHRVLFVEEIISTPKCPLL